MCRLVDLLGTGLCQNYTGTLSVPQIFGPDLSHGEEADKALARPHSAGDIAKASQVADELQANRLELDVVTMSDSTL